MDKIMIRLYNSTIWTLMTILCLSEAIKLTDHILHYEGLDYDRAHINMQHRRIARSTRTSPHRVDIKFSAHGRDFHLRLKRDIFTFSKEFTVVTSQGEVPLSFEDSPMYIGELVDEPNTYCHGSVKDGQFEGRILVSQSEDYYSVEPSSRYMNDTSFHSVIYKDDDVVLPEKHKMLQDEGLGSCGVKGEIKKRMEEKLKNLKHTEDESDDEPFRWKRQTINEDEQTCSLFIQTDHTFFERHGSISGVVNQIGQHVQSASFIYNNADFGDYRNISFSVERMRVWTPDDIGNVNYLFGNNFIGVEKYLDLASTGNFNAYCLAYTFANRDFANGVLGLAWIASSSRNSNGGLCDKQTSNGQTLNTGIVTTNNYESNVPPLISHLTLAHEIGHSFGSQHDPASDACTPGGSLGNYIMFSHSSSGNLINNQRFSPCSISSISTVLSTVFLGHSKPNCFKSTADITFCGNGITEDGEECDCGYEEECMHSCCIPQNADNSNPNACRLASGAVCSPTEGTCCDEDTCMYKASNEQCEASAECHGPAFCPGDSAVCPTPSPEADLTQCDGGRKLCKDGECSESICFLQSRQECQCTDTAELCDLCCKDERTGLCLSSYRLGLPPGQTEPLLTDVGSPCGDYMGYCDGFRECRQVDEDGPLASIIRKIFYSEEPQLTDAIRDWLTNYWYVVLVIGIAVIILMILIVVLCNRVIPTDNPWDQEQERFKKRSSVYVKLQRKRYRGSMAPGMHPPPIESHPDHIVEDRATPF